jgi:hypothetical protein
MAFVSAVLSETAERIRKEQQQVADDWNLFESGELKQSLMGHFAVDAQEGDGRLSMRYLNYMRFLDMPDTRRSLRRVKREGYHLYNRTVFGNLYRYGLPTLRDYLTPELMAELEGSLNTAMKGNRYIALENASAQALSGGDRDLQALIIKKLRNESDRY